MSTSSDKGPADASHVFRPQTTGRLLRYELAPKLPRGTGTAAPTSATTPQKGVPNSHTIRALTNDVAFLTEKGKAGDIVIYAGHGVGNHIVLVAKMFPTMQFIIYDGNPNPWYEQGMIPYAETDVIFFTYQRHPA